MDRHATRSTAGSNASWWPTNRTSFSTGPTPSPWCPAVCAATTPRRTSPRRPGMHETGRWLNESFLAGGDHGRDAVVDAELVHDLAQLVLDRGLAEIELLADLLVGHAFGRELEDGDLALGQLHGSLGAPAQTLEHGRGGLFVQHALAARSRTDLALEVGAFHVFDHVALGPSLDA